MILAFPGYFFKQKQIPDLRGAKYWIKFHFCQIYVGIFQDMWYCLLIIYIFSVEYMGPDTKKVLGLLSVMYKNGLHINKLINNTGYG